MNSKLSAVLCAATVALTLKVVPAQSPTPIVAKAVVSATAETNSNSTLATLKSLREIKAANEEILKKQQTTLEALDELQKAADQIKIFTKRG
jgi:hypothetical protein